MSDEFDKDLLDEDEEAGPIVPEIEGEDDVDEEDESADVADEDEM